MRTLKTRATSSPKASRAGTLERSHEVSDAMLQQWHAALNEDCLKPQSSWRLYRMVDATRSLLLWGLWVES